MFKWLGLKKYDPILIISLIILFALLWIGLRFSLIHGRLPHGSGEVLNWLFGWGHG